MVPGNELGRGSCTNQIDGVNNIDVFSCQPSSHQLSLLSTAIIQRRIESPYVGTGFVVVSLAMPNNDKPHENYYTTVQVSKPALWVDFFYFSPIIPSATFRGTSW